MALTLQMLDRRKMHNLRNKGKLGYVDSKKCRSMRKESRNGTAVKDICQRSQDKVSSKSQATQSLFS